MHHFVVNIRTLSKTTKHFFRKRVLTKNKISLNGPIRGPIRGHIKMKSACYNCLIS